ncbi:hypothetical protein ACFL4L_01870 [bacterium]
MKIQILEHTGDARGWLYQLQQESHEFIGEIREMHMASIKPGSIRGNHLHLRKKEMLVMMVEDTCQLYWKLPEKLEPKIETFNKGTIVIEIEPGTAHAIYNNGQKDLIINSYSDTPYSPETDDTEPIILIKP